MAAKGAEANAAPTATAPKEPPQVTVPIAAASPAATFALAASAPLTQATSSIVISRIPLPMHLTSTLSFMIPSVNGLQIWSACLYTDHAVSDVSPRNFPYETLIA
jgi:hypothetical protein